MDCNMPGFPVLHHLPELAQTHVHWVSDGCHPTISSSVLPFSSCLQSFPASGSFPMSQFFVSGSQSIGASASVLPMNIQDWFPLGLSGWISLLSKGLSRVFSNTTAQKHQFFVTQPSLQSNSHIHAYYWDNCSFVLSNNLKALRVNTEASWIRNSQDSNIEILHKFLACFLVKFRLKTQTSTAT